MNQTILMHADIHKRTEINDIPDCTGQDHARLQIRNFQHIGRKHRRREIIAQIASRLLHLGYDIRAGAYQPDR